MTRSSMYQIYVSSSGHLEPGPRFKLLIDAVRFVESQGSDKSFAIRDPDGSWYRDAQGRSIFGRRAERTRKAIARLPRIIARPVVDRAPPDPDEVTQPLGSPPKLARGTGRVHVVFSASDPQEVTDVIWPPIGGR